MTATLTYYRHGSKETETHPSVEEALRAAYWGEETGHISTHRVEDETGSAAFDRSRDGNIFAFCERGEYDWVASWVDCSQNGDKDE